MRRTVSLRTRLVLIILTPLMAVSLVLGILAFKDAKNRAADRFDRSLLSIVLAISRDTALSGGDALSPATRDLLRDTSGGPVFYHVYAPNGAYVTGYATPPVLPASRTGEIDSQAYYDATYQRRQVRVLRFVDKMAIGRLNGNFTFTVWQNIAVRDSFVRDSTQATFGLIAVLVATLALIVWFGVRIGLRPLLDLQDAISRRSSGELNPIQRPVPIEVAGIVRTLNGLLSEMRATFRAKDEFISNAAHQLRNPIAGVLAMSEAVRSATTMADVRQRSEDLVTAAQSASDLANNLLAFERARTPPPISEMPAVAVNELVKGIISTSQGAAAKRQVRLKGDLMPTECRVRADPVLLQQSILNLVDNALKHGGPTLTQVLLKTRSTPGRAQISVIDDGRGIPPDQFESAVARFGQAALSEGSGLGLPISIAVAESNNGSLELKALEDGLDVTISIPRCDGAM